MESLLNQARKYKVGLILAHQNLDQFDHELQATVMASTSIKLAGGVSAKDAAILAKEMRCEPEDILSVQKGKGRTRFLLYIRNKQPTFLEVNLGMMESRPRISQKDLEVIRERIRAKYCVALEEGPAPSLEPQEEVEILEASGVSRHEMV